MKLLKEISWYWSAIPRTPERSGILMRLFYFWDEALTPAGHTVAALILFGLFFIFIPGFRPVLFIVGVFFFYLSISVVFRFKPSSRIGGVSVPMATEGSEVQIAAKVSGKDQKFCFVESFRMDTSVERLENGRLLPHRRGVFPLPKIALVKLNLLGLSRGVRAWEKALELLVVPRTARISAFPFLLQGSCGSKFECLLRPRTARGLEFVGIREYRDGDSLRDLHQKAFARYCRPFTKEYAVETGGGVVLLLDVSAKKWREKMCVESAIRLCGGIASWLLERNLLGRFFIGNEEFLFDNAKSARSRILEALARVPAAELRSDYELGKWNFAVGSESPVLSVSVRNSDRENVDKRIVVALDGPFGTNPDGSVRRISNESLSFREGSPDAEVAL